VPPGAYFFAFASRLSTASWIWPASMSASMAASRSRCTRGPSGVRSSNASIERATASATLPRRRSTL
jgi:hypothetical protein